jgi:hypothetical protein
MQLRVHDLDQLLEGRSVARLPCTQIHGHWLLCVGHLDSLRDRERPYNAAAAGVRSFSLG